MQVVIAQSFTEPHAALFQIGEILEVPEETAARWIAANRAVPLGEKPGDPTKQAAAKPAAKRETAVKKPRETR